MLFQMVVRSLCSLSNRVHRDAASQEPMLRWRWRSILAILRLGWTHEAMPEVLITDV
jgi:hypothetical protein